MGRGRRTGVEGGALKVIDIDFLPIEYRRRRPWRQSQAWQIAATAAVIGLLAASAFVQQRRLCRAQAELTAIAPAYETAVNFENRLADLRRRLNHVQACAELYTYLRHPWPRTQLLAAAMAPLPDEITLEQLQIVREPAAPPSPSAPPSPGEVRSSADRKTPGEPSLPPALSDLAKLRNRIDPTRTVVVLTGTAAESAALHRYLGKLDAEEIFDRVELDRFDNVVDGRGGKSLRFRAVLAVQPGYGQLSDGGKSR